MLFGPGSKLKTISNQQEYEVAQAGGIDMGQNALGFRAGFEKYTVKRWGLGVRLEGGVRPGYGRTPYMRFDLILPVFSVTRSPKKATDLLKKLDK